MLRIAANLDVSGISKNLFVQFAVFVRIQEDC